MTDDPIETESIEPPKRNLISRIFTGPNGLRVIWGILLFLVFVVALAAIVAGIVSIFHKPSHTKGPATPTRQLIEEALELLVVAGATWLMSLVEHRKFLVYNLTSDNKLVRFFTGFFWGSAALSFLIGVLWALGFITFGGVALKGADILIYAGAWGAVFIAVGFFEEMFVRGYLQYTLTRGLGFWWAALITSLFFLVLHLGNSGESAVGLSAVALVGLTFCLSIYYTGSLWWAIGFHASWDWAQSYFFGTSDSGMTNVGHFLNSHPTGNPFWSGGPDGPEGSAFIIPMLLLICLCMWLWWGRKKAVQIAN